MGKRDELIARYADDLRNRCGVEPDPVLLERVAIGCGPAIYDPEAAFVSASDPAELSHIRENYLVRKLDMRDGPELSDAIDAVLEIYGPPDVPKYRAVVYYLLTRHFRKEAHYGREFEKIRL